MYFIPFCNSVISVGWLRQYDGLDDRKIVVRFLKRLKSVLKPTQAPRLLFDDKVARPEAAH
jgi:hypothetical protein